MKHLKRFNESTLDKEEVQDFCETHLAYLIDEGLEVECYQFNESNKEVAYITLGYKLENDSHNLSPYEYNFPSWNDIKDNIIPFFTHLSNKYDLLKNGKEVCISYVTTYFAIDDNFQKKPQVYNSGNNFKFTLKDIINDKTEVLGKLNGRFRILEIRFDVIEKLKPNTLDKIKSLFK
jgi:hypothetical protein